MPRSSQIPEYLRTKDVARRLGLSHSLVRRWTSTGVIPSHKLGDAPRSPVLVAVADLERFLAAHRREAAEEVVGRARAQQ
ncbi:MAG: helix-turn-helix domain-containing protein [Planctomycetes bacterium]|nr:helix-turn-helix domain-containing protein [Planctomycetota bacterium]